LGSLPSLGFVLGARGKGVSEEGGRRVESQVFISWKQSKEYVDPKVRTML